MAMLRRAGPFINRLLHMTVTTGQGISSATSNNGSSALCSRRLQLIFPAHRFCSSGESEAVGVDLSNEESKRRLFNRLLYRSRQRGFLELDLVLGKWVEEHINSMDGNGIKSLVQVLDLENPDLWKWLTEQEMPPEAVSTNPVFSALQDKVLNNLNNHSSPETRAAPGQPWVRGWDDFSKGRYSPISGNQ